MVSEIFFGTIDNGILVGGAILGFSLEDLINHWLESLFEKSKYKLQTRVKGLSGSLLGAGMANAISDFLGGWCIGWEMAFGSALGCLIIVLLTLPIIFKLEVK